MTWIIRNPVVIAHTCSDSLPNLEEERVGPGSQWRCDQCGSVWTTGPGFTWRSVHPSAERMNAIG